MTRFAQLHSYLEIMSIRDHFPIWREVRQVLCRVALFAALSAMQSHSATAVIPQENENQAGNTGGGPFTAEDYRYQVIYHGSQFVRLMPQGGEITEIAFRVDESLRFPQQTVIEDMEIRMSTSPSLAPVLPHPFASRVGADETIVFQRGSLGVIVKPNATGPNPFSIVIPLTRSFNYNPAGGDLVVDFWMYRGGNQNGNLTVDGDSAVGIAWGALNLRETSDNPSVAPIMRLTYNPVPEPAAWAILSAGFVVFMGARRIR